MTRQQLSKYNLVITLKSGKILEDSVFEWIGQYYTKRFGKKLSYGNPSTPEKVIELIQLNNCISGIDISEVESLNCYLTKKLKNHEGVHSDSEL